MLETKLQILDPQRLLETNLFCSCFRNQVLSYRWLILMRIAFWDSHPLRRSMRFASHYQHYKKVFIFLPRIHTHTYKQVMEKIFYIEYRFSVYSFCCKFSTSPQFFSKLLGVWVIVSFEHCQTFVTTHSAKFNQVGQLLSKFCNGHMSQIMESNVLYPSLFSCSVKCL